MTRKDEILQEIEKLEMELYWLDNEESHDQADLSLINSIYAKLDKLKKELDQLK